MNTDSKYTLRELTDSAVRRLTAVYPDGEARMLLRIIYEELKGWSQVDRVILADQPVTQYFADKVNGIVERLLRHEPIQYIFSSARFYGLQLKVTPAVLIPRQETEELVDMIVSDYRDRTDLRIIDLCTGSGCIAVALARNLPFPEVEGVDNSAEALEVARENAKLLKVSVDFRLVNVLEMPEPTEGEYDIVVSNPPYIVPSEKKEMEQNVLDYEPSAALFVPENDPFLFYKAISRWSLKSLAAGGRIYFEINPLFAAELKRWMTAEGWADVELFADMQKKQRFLRAQKPVDQ